MSARRAGERAAAAPLPCDSAISVSLARAAADFDGCPAEAGRRATAGTALPPSATAVDSRKMTVLSLSLSLFVSASPDFLHGEQKAVARRRPAGVRVLCVFLDRATHSGVPV